MSQIRTSAATSINKNRLPAVYSRFTFAPRSVVLDYGCGRYTEHIRKALPDSCVYLPFDPYNQPESVNEKNRFLFSFLARFSGRPAVIVCSNVLNVIDDDEALQETASELFDLVLSTAGTALVTVYEGDKSGTGRETGPDQWQRNQRIRDYLALFPEGRATVSKNTIIIK